MILLPDHHAVFISTPKVATHSMYQYLIEHYGGHHKGGLTQTPYHPRVIPAEARNWMRFTNVRNPFTRAVSTWYSFSRKNKNRDEIVATWGGNTFLHFCKWLLARDPNVLPYGAFETQTAWHEQNARTADLHFLRLEHLTEDFAQLPFAGTPPPIPYKHVRQHEYGEWRDQYNGETKLLIAEFAEDDFSQYGYPFNMEEA